MLPSACSQPLGLTTHAIEDWQLAASSRLSSDPHCAVKHARLHRRGSRAWCPQNKVMPPTLTEPKLDRDDIALLYSPRTNGCWSTSAWPRTCPAWRRRGGARSTSGSLNSWSPTRSTPSSGSLPVTSTATRRSSGAIQMRTQSDIPTWNTRFVIQLPADMYTSTALHNYFPHSRLRRGLCGST